MKNIKPVLSFFLLSFSLMGYSTNSEVKASSKRALFDTRQEAEKAAKDFNCMGAHKMGDKWMPCKSHDAHKEEKKHGGHHHHH